MRGRNVFGDAAAKAAVVWSCCCVIFGLGLPVDGPLFLLLVVTAVTFPDIRTLDGQILEFLGGHGHRGFGLYQVVIGDGRHEVRGSVEDRQCHNARGDNQQGIERPFQSVSHQNIIHVVWLSSTVLY